MAALPVLLDATAKCPEALRLQNDLRARVIGQDEAISRVVDQYQTYLAGLGESNRPISSFLLLGPTGCGKTRLAEAVAESLAGSRDALIKIDCGEFQHSHEIAKLIGSPPGYLGHRETHARLSQERLDEYHTESVRISFVLFDEIEKASDALWNLLLGILDKATLTLGDNRQVDFSKTMVFLTGNLGVTEINHLLEAPLGFAADGKKERNTGGVITPATQRKLEDTVLRAARRKFSPEFLNRLDRIILCHRLSREDMAAVLELELREVLRRITRRRGINLRVSLSEAARNFLIDEGYSERDGARHLKRALQKTLLRPLSSLLATDQLRDGDELLVGLEEGARELYFGRDRPLSPRNLPRVNAPSRPGANAPLIAPGRWQTIAVRQ
ncbi:MAG: AAA family ATPase [Bryobacterales bacterium]|nr:AAA family ATPase [Bryobacterales bacterium]